MEGRACTGLVGALISRVVLERCCETVTVRTGVRGWYACYVMAPARWRILAFDGAGRCDLVK